MREEESKRQAKREQEKSRESERDRDRETERQRETRERQRVQAHARRHSDRHKPSAKDRGVGVRERLALGLRGNCRLHSLASRCEETATSFPEGFDSKTNHRKNM